MNIPIQVISCTDTNGRITPLRFRFKNDKEELVTIDNVVVRQRSQNTSVLSFTCESIVEDRSSEFTLFYRVIDHVWFMQKEKTS